MRYTKRRLNKLIREIGAYLATPEGKASLRQAREEAEQLCAELRRKRAVDPLSLFERITI